MRKAIALAFICLPLLSGCMKSLFPDPEADAKKTEDEAAATGSGCKQAGRSLEDCYLRNEGLNRKGALRGWQDMDEYMRVNKLQPQPPSKEMADKELALKDAAKDVKDKEAAKDGAAKDEAAPSKDAPAKSMSEKDASEPKGEKKP